MSPPHAGRPPLLRLGGAYPVWEHPAASSAAVGFFSPGSAINLLNTRFSVSSLRLQNKSLSAAAVSSRKIDLDVTPRPVTSLLFLSDRGAGGGAGLACWPSDKYTGFPSDQHARPICLLAPAAPVSVEEYWQEAARHSPKMAVL